MNNPVLAGRRIVVTRAVAQGQPLVDAIRLHGGEVVVLPLIEIRDAEDGGAELRDCLRALTKDDWLVVLSPNGASRVVSLLGPDSCRLAVIASGTGSVFVDAGWTIDLMPETASSEGLLEDFGSVEVRGRVLIAQAEGGRTVLADGLRARGVDVEVAVAYRNVVPTIDEHVVDAARKADSVVFASPSAVRRYADVVGVIPANAVCIGTVTAAEAAQAGFEVSTAASPTTDAQLAALYGA